MQPTDQKMMARALELAQRGIYTTQPNPRVGCVLAVDGEIVGEGWHWRAGEPHAEVMALQHAGVKARGATCYVSLEPCCHTGRTGPCTNALVEAGVSRVVYAMEDPDPRVGGRGVEQLRAAGMQVDGPILETAARAINAGYIKRLSTGRPLVRVKMAMSLDGRTAMPDGNSFWITGPQARADVHKLRARSCAVLSGWRSVMMDQSQMTVRADEFGLEDEGLGQRQPLRVLVDSQLRLPRDARYFQEPSPILVVNAQRSGQDAQVEHLQLQLRGEHLDLDQLMDELGRRQVNELLVESGPALSGAFVRAGLVDELVIYVAPKLMGSDAAPLFDLPLLRMPEALPLHIQEIRHIGADFCITAILEKE